LIVRDLDIKLFLLDLPPLIGLGIPISLVSWRACEFTGEDTGGRAMGAEDRGAGDRGAEDRGAEDRGAEDGIID
jgi:hypothetical protein